MVRRAPPGFTLIGEPAAGGSGECVALSRIVLGVRQGAAEGIYTFFVTMLGSRCELKQTVSPSGMVAVCFAVAYIGSGQQIIFEERDDERCAPLIEPGARGGEPRPARCALGVYLQSREAYRTAFMACAAAGRLVAATTRRLAGGARTSRFFASIDDTGIELELRSIEHPLCPRGVGRGGIRGCFGAPAVQRVRGVAAAADEHEVPLRVRRQPTASIKAATKVAGQYKQVAAAVVARSLAGSLSEPYVLCLYSFGMYSWHSISRKARHYVA